MTEWLPIAGMAFIWIALLAIAAVLWREIRLDAHRRRRMMRNIKALLADENYIPAPQGQTEYRRVA